ncbi:MAG: iron-containing alcohol dehydrogenase PsrA [Rhodospirillaceae bacterium]
MWTYWNPTRIIFGAGAVVGIGDAIKGRRYVIVTYDQPLFKVMADRIVAAAGKPAGIIDNVVTNPDYKALTEASALFAKAGQVECIVALGGGSIIDEAKVLAAGGGDFGRVRQFLETGDGADGLSAIPIVAVPTTAGTGSEVTCWATVWDTENNKKYSLARPNLYPESALIDPDLTIPLPRGLTVSTGLDALSHALESIWNLNANPVSSSHAVAASREALAVLPLLADDLGNPGLRARMARAAMMAGLAFSNTKTALAHSLSYPITLRHGVPHGVACSFSLPMVMRWVMDANADCDASLKAIFGDDLRAGADRLQAMIESLGVGTTPGDHGVADTEWKDLVQDALAGERGRNFLGDSNSVLNSL